MFNADFQDYSKRNLRRISTDKLRVSTGYKSPDVLRAVTDLLLSEKLYFIDVESKRRCIVTSDANTVSKKTSSPEAISLIVAFSDDEQRYIPVSQVHDITYILGNEDNDIILTEDGFMIGV